MVGVLKMAYRGLAKKRLRFALTAAGIAIGVALTFSLLSITATAEQVTLQAVRRLVSYDIAVVNASVRGALTPFRQAPAQVSQPAQPLMREDVVAAIASIQGVYAVAPVLSLRGSLGGTSVTLQGIDSVSYLEVVGGVNVVEGSMFSCDGCPEVVVGRSVASDLNLSLGDRVVLSAGSASREVVVVGVFETGMRFQETLVYVPLRLLQEVSGLSGYVTQVLVKCAEPRYVEPVANTIRQAFPGLTVISQQLMVSRVEETLGTVSLFFLSIGLVALTAGGFGVMNTMFMSVSERVREIGILKSIGATDGFVFALFLVESAIIGAVGSAAGLAAGILLSQLVPRFVALAGVRGLPLGGPLARGQSPAGFAQQISGLVVTPEVAAVSVLVGLAVSIVAGVLPAYRAAKIRPAEAIRYV